MNVRNKLAAAYGLSHALNSVPKLQELHFLNGADNLDSFSQLLNGRLTQHEMTKFRAGYFSYLRSGPFKENGDFDALIVFTGGQINDQPTVLTLQRGLKAMEGVSCNPSAVLVLSGGFPLISIGFSPKYSDAALLEEYLHNISSTIGVDMTKTRVLKDETSKETMGNGLFSYFVLTDEQIIPQRVALITNEEHIKRAEMTMQIDWNGADMMRLNDSTPYFSMRNKNGHINIEPFGVPSLGRISAQSEKEALEAIYFARYIGFEPYGVQGIWNTKHPVIEMVESGRATSKEMHTAFKNAYDQIVCGPGLAHFVLRDYLFNHETGRIVLGQNGLVHRMATKDIAGMDAYRVR